MSTASELVRFTAAELAAKIAAREVSSTEVTRACLDQIEATDGEYHAFLHVSADQALAAAAAVDAKVAAATGQSHVDFALWGGLMTTRAMHLKAAGAVLDGYWRDTPEVAASGLPVFGFGGYAQDQGPRGKVVDWRVPVEIAGVRVAPGDIVFGDLDGVLVIPRAVEEEAIRRALEKSATENKVRDAIQGGMSTVEAFRTFGVM